MKSKIDKSNMHKVIIDFPKQFRVGLAVAKDVMVRQAHHDFNQIIFCGMGGSALPAEILKMLRNFYEWPVAIKIHKSYGLPARVSSRALIFTISYSGNTEETISSYEEAKKRNLTIIGIASGGKLIELCQKDQTPFVKLPPLKIQPRSAIGYQFGSIIKILSNSNIIKDLDNDILALEKTLKSKTLENQGKKIAQKIKGCIPIIYASDKFKALAQIWKINFNENSKSPAFWNYFPELNHNEMEGFQEIQSPKSKVKSNFHIIILRDKKLDRQRILKRMAVTGKLLKEKGLDVSSVDIQGQNLVMKIFSAILLSLWMSYYLALEYETDPTPVKTVEEFKKKLR
jgi:glucose/mannose-6-phosphate isomerase